MNKNIQPFQPALFKHYLGGSRLVTVQVFSQSYGEPVKDCRISTSIGNDVSLISIPSATARPAFPAYLPSSRTFLQFSISFLFSAIVAASQAMTATER